MPAPVAVPLVLAMFFAAFPGPAQEESAAASRPDAAQKAKKQRKKSREEMGSAYQPWLQEEVPDIITPEEIRAFRELATNEEREQFIELFWRRRNPDPDSSENPVKEEHYRRLAYANEHFSSGVAGQKTDRGHIYILWGPPDEIESHPTGGTYDRPASEGGGSTTTYPWERWRYRHLEEIGENVELEFVDPSGTGEYHLTRDPGEKDAMAKVPGAGLGTLEQLHLASKADRFSNSGTSLPKTLGGSSDPFDSLDRYFRVLRQPAHLKELEPYVSVRFLTNQLPFTYGADYLRVTSDSDLVPITIQVANRELGFRGKDGVHTATLNLYARISTPGGRMIQTFEEALTRDFPDSLFAAAVEQSSVYQKIVPLRPGLYRLDLVLKDMESGKIGVINASLRVPRYDSEKLDASTLLLADQIAPVASAELGYGPFVLGALKVRPRLNHEFTRSEKLGVWLQLYNLGRDGATGRAGVTVLYRLTRDHQEIWKFRDSPDELRQPGEQVTLRQVFPLAALSPGTYVIELTATDATGQSLSRSATFTVKAAAEVKAAAKD